MIVSCHNTPDEIIAILGKPLTAELATQLVDKVAADNPDLTPGEVDRLEDDAFEFADSECHLPKGSEGSVDYAPRGLKSSLLAI